MEFDPSIPENYQGLYKSILEAVRTSSDAFNESAAFYEDEDTPRHDSYFFYSWVKAIPADKVTQAKFKKIRENAGIIRDDTWRNVALKGIGRFSAAQEIFEGSAGLTQRTAFEHLVGYLKNARDKGADLYGARGFEGLVEPLLESGDELNSSTLTPEQSALFFDIVKSLPDTIQKDLLDKLNHKELIIAELEALVAKLQEKINELLKNENITDEIKVLVEAGKIDEAEAEVDRIVATTVKEQQRKHGEYFYQQGKIKEIRLKYREAYEALEKAVNAQPENIKFLNSVGLSAREIAKFDKAEKYLDRSLKLTINEFGEDHLESATSYNNLASSIDDQGRYSEAEPLYRKALEIFKSMLGEDNSKTAISYNNVAYNLNLQGRLKEAEPLQREVLEINQRVLGTENYYTALSYNNLALNLNGQARYCEAEPLYSKALEMFNHVLGKNHPNTAICYRNVAQNLVDQARFEDAETLQLKALETHQCIFGDRHPETAACYNNLAYNLNQQGRYREAEPLFRKTLEICKCILGEDHPNTAMSYNNVAQNLDAQGRHEEAEPLLLIALDSHQRILGEEHRSTALSYNNIAHNLEAQGQYVEAESLYRKALKIRQRVLGRDHPDTAMSYHKLALNHSFQGKYDEALYRQSIEILERTLGEKHSTTKTLLKSWESNRPR